MRDVAWKLAAALLSLAVSATAADAIFRVYEARRRTHSLDFEGPVVDLASVQYNETRIARREGEGEFRVLGFGDSYAYGVVKRPYNYHFVAERLLAEAAPPAVRIVNLGEPAVSFHRYLNAYEYWGSLLEHDAVVFTVFVGNDFEEANRAPSPVDRELNRIYNQRDFDIQTGRKRFINIPHKFPLRMLDYAWAHYLTLTHWHWDEVASRRGPYTLALGYDEPDFLVANAKKQLLNFDPDHIGQLARGWAAFGELVRQASRARREGMRVVFFVAPNEAQALPRLRNALAADPEVDLAHYDLGLPDYLIRELVGRIDREIEVVDLTELLLCADADGLITWHPKNTHWDLDGNRVVGERLAQYVSLRWLGRPLPQEAALTRCARETALLGGTPEPTPLRRRVARELLDPIAAAPRAVAHAPQD